MTQPISSQNPAPRTISLHQPRHLSFGSEARLELIDSLRESKLRNALLIIPEIILEHQQPWVEQLRDAVATLEIITETPPEPTLNDLAVLRPRVNALELDVVIAVGGGSTLDIAKVLAALYRDETDARKYLGKGLLAGRPLKLFCVPTTAGAGSEASPNAIFYDEEAGLKSAIISHHLVPDAVFLDPTFAVTLPPHVTAATGFDAMCHCIEAYTNRFFHPVVDAYALEGTRLIAAHLERAVRDGGDLEARLALARGSYLGGLCLGPVNTAAVHALSYPLGSRYRLAHGLSNAILMPPVFAFNLSAMPDRFATIARALGVTLEGSDEDVAQAGIAQLRDLARRCRLDLSLQSRGITSEAIDQLATDAMKVTRLLRNNPRDVTFDDARTLYAQALIP